MSRKQFESDSELQLPEFQSAEELVQFFNTQDMGTFLDRLPAAEFHVDLQARKLLVPVDESLINRLAAVAQAHHLPVEDLIDLWIREKLSHYSQA
jgi:hypothetical protein